MTTPYDNPADVAAHANSLTHPEPIGEVPGWSTELGWWTSTGTDTLEWIKAGQLATLGPGLWGCLLRAGDRPVGVFRNTIAAVAAAHSLSALDAMLLSAPEE